MGSSDEVVVVRVETLLELLGLCRELLLGGCPGTIPGDVGCKPWVLHVVDVAVDHVAKLRRGGKSIEEVVPDLPIVQEIGSRVLATRLQGSLKDFGSLPVA